METFCGFPAINSWSVRRNIARRKSSSDLLNIVEDILASFRLQVYELFNKYVFPVRQSLFLRQEVKAVRRRRRKHLASSIQKPLLTDPKLPDDQLQNGVNRLISADLVICNGVSFYTNSISKFLLRQIERPTQFFYSFIHNRFHSFLYLYFSTQTSRCQQKVT